MEINCLFKVVAKAPMLGRQRGKFDFKTVDGVVTCDTTFMRNTVPVEDLKFDGNAFTGVCYAPSPMGKMKLEVEGVIDGDSISGVMRTDLGDMPYSGEKAEE